MRSLGRAKPKTVDYEYMTVDIETTKDKVYGSALLGEPNYITWCINGHGYGEASNDLSTWLIEHFLIPQYDKFILYAHNGFGFDMKRVDWQLIAEYGFQVDFLTGNEGSIKSITITSDDFMWTIRDSLLLIPRKLSEVTKKFAPGNEKIVRKDSFDVRPFDPTDKDDQEYAIQDAVGLWIAIGNVDKVLRERFGVSIHEAATLPGLAFRAFRLMFEPGDRKAEKKSERYPGISWAVAHAARESYHGGQTIAFRTSAFRDVVSLDANSMYSYVMLSCPLPTGEVKRYGGLPKNCNRDNTLCFAVVHIPQNVFPLLKTQNARGSVGNFRGVVSGWYWLFELEKQKELGGTYEVLESYMWDSSTKCAARFVELCRQLRMQDYFGAIGEVAKLLANSLYGKFAQQVGEFTMQLSKEIPTGDSFPIYDPVRRDVVPNLWNVKGKPSFSADMTHWASFITAQARMILTNAIQLAGFENIIYCDTDSIFVERKYLSRLRSIMGKEYGQFKIEKGTEDKGIPFQAIAPKAYLFIDSGHKLKIKNKGIPTRDILQQDGFSRMGSPDESVSFISSNNLMQMIKSEKGYGRRSARKMATVQSTTNGKIINDVWHPSTTTIRNIEDIRGDSTLNNTTPFYLKKQYDMIVQEFQRKEGDSNETA